MDLTSLRCLINSISRFIHLVTCNTSKTMPAEKDFRDLASLLKHLKPVLDVAADQKANQDEVLSEKYEELDIAVNEAREFFEKWSPKMSKILCVLRSKPLLLKIQISSVDLSHMLCKIFESSPASSSFHNAELYMQEAQNVKLGKLSEQIEEILRSQKEGNIHDTKHLMTITESLGLKSGPEFLSELIALEKERQKAEDNKMEGDFDQISEIVDLMYHIRVLLVKPENLKEFNGIQIPSDFICPLSSEIMWDPVIVASGQTYERSAIQKWLDHGLVKCPKTGNILSNKFLIPNYTVKALIENWCNENKLVLSDNSHKVDTGDQNDLNSTNQSLVEVGHCVDAQNDNVTPGDNEEGYNGFQEELEKTNQSSPDYSYVHSRSESASSAIFSNDYLPTTSAEASRISSKHDDLSDRSGDVTSAYPTSLSTKVSRGAASLSQKPYSSSKTMAEMEKRNPSRTLLFSSESSYNDSTTTTSHIEKLVNDLKSSSTELQTAAAGELRFLAKHNMDNRFIIGQCGAIGPLISLLQSNVGLAQEHAVTALLNLSINEQIKANIAEEGALEPLIHVLRTGSGVAKENAAATLFSISLINEFRIKIGRSGAVKALVDLLGFGTIRGKKDAATALFNLSIFHDNKARIIQAGAVKYLVGLMDPASELVDKAVAVLANLSTINEGCMAIAREGGIPLLVEIVEMGSQRGKENAASILLQMCINSTKYCQSVLQEGAVPPLVVLSQSGTPRAKEKAQQLLSHFRNQRESAKTRGRT